MIPKRTLPKGHRARFFRTQTPAPSLVPPMTSSHGNRQAHGPPRGPGHKRQRQTWRQGQTGSRAGLGWRSLGPMTVPRPEPARWPLRCPAASSGEPSSPQGQPLLVAGSHGPAREGTPRPRNTALIRQLPRAPGRRPRSHVHPHPHAASASSTSVRAHSAGDPLLRPAPGMHAQPRPSRGRPSHPLCACTVTQHQPQAFPRRGNHPRSHTGGGLGAVGEQTEGLLEEVPLPTGPEGQAQLEELVEPGAGPLTRLFLTPAQSRPALPPRPVLGTPSSSHPHLDRGGQGCMLGPGTTSLHKDAGNKATVRPHLRFVFLTLTLPQTAPPPRVYQNKRPNSHRAQEAEPPGQAGSSLASRESRDPVISGGPGTCSILGLKGSDMTRSPSPGLQVHPDPKEALRAGLSLCSWPPTPPWASGPLADKGALVRSETSGLPLQAEPSGPTVQADGSAGLVPQRVCGHWPALGSRREARAA